MLEKQAHFKRFMKNRIKRQVYFGAQKFGNPHIYSFQNVHGKCLLWKNYAQISKIFSTKISSFLNSIFLQSFWSTLLHASVQMSWWRAAGRQLSIWAGGGKCQTPPLLSSSWGHGSSLPESQWREARNPNLSVKSPRFKGCYNVKSKTPTGTPTRCWRLSLQ